LKKVEEKKEIDMDVKNKVQNESGGIIQQAQLVIIWVGRPPFLLPDGGVIERKLGCQRSPPLSAAAAAAASL